MNRSLLQEDVCLKEEVEQPEDEIERIRKRISEITEVVQDAEDHIALERSEMVDAADSIIQSFNQVKNQYFSSLPKKLKTKFIYNETRFFQALVEGRTRKAMIVADEITKMLNGLNESVVRPSESEIGCRQTKLRKKFDSTDAKVMGVQNNFKNKDVGVSDFSASNSSSKPAPTNKDAMVGFDEDLIAIKARLCGESSKLQVLPIVGMGGIGKTTLAGNVYNDSSIIQHFDIRAWVTISQYYSVEEIIQDILVSMEEFNTVRRRSKLTNEESVFKTLKGRRFLIVMDDMWTTEAWDDVMNVFPNDNNGSRIMLTTRLFDVAAYPNLCSRLHRMRFMNFNESWNLLKQKVFTDNQDSPPELEVIGKEIARSCRGLPLAIVVIAGLLSTVTHTPTSWRKIAKSVNFATSKDEQIGKILSLSYTHLPHHLRPCFLYMGCFPEDHEINVSILIKLWVAEGFLENPNGSKSYEEVAEEYLDDLVKRSLVLVTKRKSNSQIKSCSLHDLMRDFCITKAQDEKFLLHVKYSDGDNDLLKSIKYQQRIIMDRSGLDWLARVHGSTIHTIMCFRCVGKSLRSLGGFNLLRVLDMLLISSGIQFPVVVVCKLFHLRYLSFALAHRIPTAISNLQNLQTLIIHSTICSLPVEIWRMPNLRHIVFSSFDKFLIPKRATFALENLQTLSTIRNLKCSKRVLKMIPNLKKLGIIYSGDQCGGDYQLNNLVYLHQLESLKLTVHARARSLRNLNAAFPMTLKNLTLRGWRLSWNDLIIIGSLPDLQVLKLRDIVFQCNQWETTEGQFPELQYLLIDGSDLQHWMTDSSHFPKLKCLVLHGCRRLSEIPYGVGEIPTLELIEVDGWDRYLLESAKQMQEEQQRYGDDVFQVRCVRH